MSVRNRIIDMLPAIIVWSLVSLFGTYVAIAYVERDPFWLRTVAEHRMAVDPSPSTAPATATPTKVHGAASG